MLILFKFSKQLHVTVKPKTLTHLLLFHMASSAACVLAMTRLLEQFTDANASKFKQLLIKELEYDNEAQLLCKMLPLLSKSMTNKCLITLKNKTMKLAEQQTSKYDKTISVYKQIQQQYKDRLSKLHSDIIDYFGTFLDKKQSIEIGYLNKQLYIETQKQSYLLKRLNDEISIDDFTIDRFHWKQTNPFCYSLPKSVDICVQPDEVFNYAESLLHKSDWFQNIFNVLNSFTCGNIDYLTYIPINKFFGQKGHFKHCKYTGRLHQIEKFQYTLKKRPRDSDQLQSLIEWCKNFNNYYTRYCGSEFANIRSIKELGIDTVTVEDDGDNDDDDNTDDCGIPKQILLTLGQVSSRIRIENSEISIDSMDDYKKIFHSNLQMFEFNNASEIVLRISQPIAAGVSIEQTKSYEFELSLVINKKYYHIDSMIQFVRNARKCQLLSKVKRVKLSVETLTGITQADFDLLLKSIFNVSHDDIDIDSNNNNNNNNNVTYETNNSNKLNSSKFGVNDHDDHHYDTEQKNTLMINLRNTDRNLSKLVSLFEILNDNRSEILNPMRNNICTVNIGMCLDYDDIGFTYTATCQDGEMWSYNSDTEYFGQQKEVECKDCDLSAKKLGVVYQNIIRWANNIQSENDYTDETYHVYLMLKKVSNYDL